MSSYSLVFSLVFLSPRHTHFEHFYHWIDSFRHKSRISLTAPFLCPLVTPHMCAHMSKRPCVPTLPACSSFFVCFDSDAPQSKALAKPDLLAPPPPTDALEGTDYVSFCSAQRLPKTLVDMSLYALIGMPAQQEGGVSETGVHRGALTLSARAGVKAVCKHLRSLNVYGPTAFLASCYGSAELAQGFCRLCAVWGGVYMLRRGAYAGAYPSLTPPSPLNPPPR